MRKTKKVKLNTPQYIGVNAPQKNKSYELGRGTGKSTILSYDILRAALSMPRATGVLVGSTYTQILSKTLPSTKNGLRLFGFIEDVHYVIGRSGKKMGYHMPFQSPNKWHNVIHFYTGFILILVSLEDQNSGRGLNSYIVFGDEATLLNPKKLFDNVGSTNRATHPDFKKYPMLNGQVYVSSTAMTVEGRWFNNLENNMIDEPDKYFHLRASAYWNKHNLADDWFDRMRAAATSVVQYEAEIENKRPTVSETSFYPQIDPDKHYYTAEDHHDFNLSLVDQLCDEAPGDSSFYDTDINPMLPLIISVDWGASINSMTVYQEDGWILRKVKEFFVKTPKILDDLFTEEFIPYFKHHIKKEIHFYFDRNGRSENPNSRLTYVQTATFYLENAGYDVIEETPLGLDPDHEDKFKVINLVLKHSGEPGWPTIQINRMNCPNSIISIENAPAKEDKKGRIVKNKNSERSKTLPQEFATHLSDTFDLPIYWKYKDLVAEMFGEKLDGYVTPLS